MDVISPRRTGAFNSKMDEPVINFGENHGSTFLCVPPQESVIFVCPAPHPPLKVETVTFCAPFQHG